MRVSGRSTSSPSHRGTRAIAGKVTKAWNQKLISKVQYTHHQCLVFWSWEYPRVVFWSWEYPRAANKGTCSLPPSYPISWLWQVYSWWISFPTFLWHFLRREPNGKTVHTQHFPLPQIQLDVQHFGDSGQLTSLVKRKSHRESVEVTSWAEVFFRAVSTSQPNINHWGCHSEQSHLTAYKGFLPSSVFHFY